MAVSASMLRALRSRAQLSQAEMAALMGFSCRGYQDLEIERASFAPRHVAVLERLSLKLAIERSDPDLALPSVRQEALQLSRMIVDQTMESQVKPALAGTVITGTVITDPVITDSALTNPVLAGKVSRKPLYGQQLPAGRF